MESIRNIKPIKILDILSMNTDEDHKMSAAELVSRLKEEGISTEKKSLKYDIALLNKYGHEVMVERSEQIYYYVEDRKFDIPELKILIDAIQCANFITESKSKELTMKIGNLAGSYKGELLTHNTAYQNEHKKTNEQIFYIINNIELAIQKGKKITFKYFDNGLDGSKVFRKDGALYVINPVKFTINDNKYYLVCYSDKHKNLTTYRVDRMSNVEILEEDRTKNNAATNEEVIKFLDGLFDMFGGKKESIVLRCDKTSKIIEIINDEFGRNKSIIREDDKTFDIRVNVGVGDTFYSWLATFRGQIKIEFPKAVREKYKEFLQANIENI